MKNKRFPLTLEPHQEYILEQLAQRGGYSQAEAVRRMIEFTGAEVGIQPTPEVRPKNLPLAKVHPRKKAKVITRADYLGLTKAHATP